MAVISAAAILGFVATAVLLASFWAWLLTAARVIVSWRLMGNNATAQLSTFLQSREIPPALPLLPWNPRRNVPWTAIDLLLFVGLYVLASAAAVMIADNLAGTVSVEYPWSREQILITVSFLASLAILAMGLPLISLRTGATLRDFGFWPPSLGNDLRLGLLAFVMLAPPVYALQGLLVSLWQESKHPLVEMFKEEPSTGFFAILFISAAIVAPLFEEILFRVLLQGFLEKAFARSTPKTCFASSQHLAPQASDVDPKLDIATSLPHDHNSTIAADTGQVSAENPDCAESADITEPCRRSSWMAILVSSAIFAALHYTHGPDWIPLFFLAIGLGYLYQRTHRLLPSLIVHSLLNAFSMGALWVTVHQPRTS